MRRWLKVLLAVVAALLVLLVLNAVALDRQTKDAEVTVDGGEILQLPGGDLQVVDSGPRDAPTIVLLHCYTCAIDWWDDVIPLLERDHRVIAIDLLGHGGSEKPRSGYSIPDQAELVAEALGELRVTHATVVGHSLGGTVAAALNERSEDLVGGVVIIDTPPDTGHGSLGLIARATLTPVFGEALWRTKMDFSIREGLKEAFAPGFDVPDEFVEDLKRMTYSAYDDSQSAFDSFLEESPLDQRLREHHPPLMVIFGAEEQLVEEPREALSAYADIPNARTALIQGAGHSPNVEKPAETARLIRNLARWVELREKAQARAAQEADRPTPQEVTAGCDTVRLAGPGNPDWRRTATAAGNFGLFGPGQDLSTATRVGNAFVTKTPAIVEGRKAITLRVPASERGQVSLVYGSINSARAVDEGAIQVTFEPCPDKPRTVWPGGLALADRGPITLEVVAGNSVRSLHLR